MLFEFKLPELGENIESGTVVKVTVAVGEIVLKDQTLIELETEKAVIEVPSPVAGRLQNIPIEEGDEVKVSQLIAVIETKAQLAQPVSKPGSEKPAESISEHKGVTTPAQSGTEPPKPQTPDIPVETTKTHREVSAAPSVRRFSREIGIEIATVPGSGPGGRISVEDVKAHAKQLNTDKASGTISKGIDLPDFARWGQIERKEMSVVRKKTALHLSHAWQTIPHVTQFGKADITDLEELRKRYSNEKRKLTITPFLMKVVSSALKVYQQFNTSIDTMNNEVIYKKYIHIGVAVDTDRGLLVPVVKDVDKKNIFQLADEISELAERARNRKIKVEEMRGGTFTITNLGGIGGTNFIPVVNWPEAAILGVSRARMEPFYTDNLCKPRLLLPLSLSYDHRLIDGADGARFLSWIVDAIKQPFMMDLEG